MNHAKRLISTQSRTQPNYTPAPQGWALRAEIAAEQRSNPSSFATTSSAPAKSASASAAGSGIAPTSGGLAASKSKSSFGSQARNLSADSLPSAQRRHVWSRWIDGWMERERKSSPPDIAVYVLS